mgnify:CR=1 FL=1
MKNRSRIACILGAMLAIVVALAAPAAFAGCGGGQVFSAPAAVFAAPIYQAPQILAAPVYQPVFAAPQVVYQQPAVVQQRAFVQAAPVYQQAAIVQKNVVVAKAPRQRLFSRSRSVNIQRSVVR